MTTAIVVPCHIPPSELWITALKKEAEKSDAKVIIVDDSDGNLGQLPEEWDIYDYRRQEEFLGDLYSFFAETFHKSSACRIFGHIVAYRDQYDVVIGLDSDCIVPEGFVARHLFAMRTTGFGWNNPLSHVGRYSRGYPYSQRLWPVVANMGLWENVLDINGKDRMADEPKHPGTQDNASYMVNGFTPFSGMNFAIKREAVFGFLFLPNFDYGESEFRRIDDVWGGYIFQKLIRLKRQAMTYGAPVVFHDTVVNAAEDQAEEAAMYKHEDHFIYTVDDCFATGREDAYASESYGDLFRDFTRQLYIKGTEPTNLLLPAMTWWGEVSKIYE